MNPLLAAISERDYQQQIIDLAHLHGWRTYHPHDSRHSTAGYPDLTLVRAHELVYLEVKTQNGRLRPEQTAWLNALDQATSVTAKCVRPSDWNDLEQLLRRPHR